MASIASTCRLTAKLAGNQLRPYVLSRAFRSAPACLAAQTFTMPAMSPTMTEGNITEWKVKEGDSYAAGDLLLEIETDKAQMDVEAQDDGVMAKIIQGKGSKAVKVGSPIAVIAEPGDDLSTLEMPADATAAPASPQEETKAGIDPAKSSESAAEAPPASKPSTPAESATSGKVSEQKSNSEDAKAKAPIADAGTKTLPESEGEPAKPIKQIHPLTPSVQHLLHEHGLPDSEADKIPASGPQGRVLKGDVLAYFGSIESSYPSKQAARIIRLGHLDLSNVKPAATAAPEKPTAPAPAPEAAPAPVPEPPINITIPVSFTALLEVQARIEQTLGVYLPLSSFISRASKAANENLPRSKVAKPSQDELFNDVLGLNKVGSSSFSRGHYTPQVTALPVAHAGARPKHSISRKQPDIIDFLSGKPSDGRARRLSADAFLRSAAEEPAEVGALSLSVPKEDQKRAKLFLERVKTVLESEPGRLVV